MPYRNALWLQINDVTDCSRYNIVDGVRQQDSLTEHIPDTGNLTDVGMGKEDLGLIVFTF